MYEVQLSKEATKFLAKQNQKTQERVIQKINDVAVDP